MDRDMFIRMEIDEIRKHRRLESEKVGRDLAEEAEMDWVHKHAAKFRAGMEEKFGPISD